MSIKKMCLALCVVLAVAMYFGPSLQTEQCGTNIYYCIYLWSEHLLNENCDLCEEMTSTG
jgi:hypothetical protein